MLLGPHGRMTQTNILVMCRAPWADAPSQPQGPTSRTRHTKGCWLLAHGHHHHVIGDLKLRPPAILKGNC
jgi:hypothetical protein